MIPDNKLPEGAYDHVDALDREPGACGEGGKLPGGHWSEDSLWVTIRQNLAYLSKYEPMRDKGMSVRATANGIVTLLEEIVVRHAGRPSPTEGAKIKALEGAARDAQENEKAALALLERYQQTSDADGVTDVLDRLDEAVANGMKSFPLDLADQIGRAYRARALTPNPEKEV